MGVHRWLNHLEGTMAILYTNGSLGGQTLPFGEWKQASGFNNETSNLISFIQHITQGRCMLIIQDEPGTVAACQLIYISQYVLNIAHWWLSDAEIQKVYFGSWVHNYSFPVTGDPIEYCPVSETVSVPDGSKATIFAACGPQSKLVIGETVLTSHSLTTPYESHDEIVSPCKKITFRRDFIQQKRLTRTVCLRTMIAAYLCGDERIAMAKSVLVL
jgi:hypothetical protein